jgi:chemotaxis protein CheD
MEVAKRLKILHPGDFGFGAPGTQFSTVLGSCIGMTIWHPELHIGGMCHFVLPTRPQNDKGENLDGRYGDEAWQLFRMAAKMHHTKLNEYEVKVFGGADVFAGGDKNTMKVGEKNTEKAMELLTKDRVKLITAHVGDTGSRKITFDISTGDVWVKHTANDGKMFSSTTGIN